jgi:hypothetical protein
MERMPSIKLGEDDKQQDYMQFSFAMNGACNLSIMETDSLMRFFSVIRLLSMRRPPLNRHLSFMERSLKIG